MEIKHVIGPGVMRSDGKNGPNGGEFGNWSPGFIVDDVFDLYEAFCN